MKDSDLDLLTTEEAAEILRVAPRTLRAWRTTAWTAEGATLRFVRVGRQIRYERRDVLAFSVRYASAPRQVAA